MEHADFSNKAKQLIDDLKGICASAGLGGDANEYKIVTQSFLYKFLNDKFLHEIGKIDPKLKTYHDLKELDDNQYELLMIKLGTKTAHLKPEHLLEHLFSRSNDDDFAKLFDNTLNDIAVDNSDVFSVHTAGKTEIRLFEEELIADAIDDKSQHAITASNIINKLANSKFEIDEVLSAGFDFFSTLFEYMIKDYNKDGGGKYAEYFTPHSIASVMAEILVGDDQPSNVTAYDPAAGSGTLLMNIAHKIGQDKCTIYSQDMSQKSSNLLRLNLILNGLSHSIDHIIQGNTITTPSHITKKFDYIVSNPPFKLDFSSEHDAISNLTNVNDRFFAGIPKVKPKAKDKMEIYLLFLQHIIFSLSDKGKAAIVVPSGFCTDTGSIHDGIRRYLIDNRYLSGVIHFPANVFANTNTSVSVVFVDKSKLNKEVMFVDASKLGKSIKDGDVARTVLQPDELTDIYNTFLSKLDKPEYSIQVSVDQIKDTDYMIKAGLYFSIDKKLLRNNRKNLELEKEIFSQKQLGLRSIFMDKVFRNFLTDEVVAAEINNDGWIENVQLNDLIESAVGGEWGKDAPEKNYNQAVKCIRGTDIPNIRLCCYEDIPTRYVKKEHIANKSLKANDILVEISGGSPIQSTGRISIITENTLEDLALPLMSTNFCRILRFKQQSLAPYIYHYLRLLYDHGQMFNLENNTSGIKNLIYPAFVNNIYIPLPKDRSMVDEIYGRLEAEVTDILRNAEIN